ncbi:MAG TPA: hypothetical protein VF587_02435, partial [Solirubrobacteraceae bacterium]
GGDQVVALAHTTPARGVVLTPVTNFAVRDRGHGTLSAVNSSVGVWRKLEAIRARPQVALAYHTRKHGFTDRPELVLVQGRATVLPPDPDLPRTMGEQWDRYGGDTDFGRPMEWLQRAWLRRSVVEIAVERVVVWPDLAGRGEPEAHGAPLPSAPPSQSEPRNGTAPRVDHHRAARRARRLPHVLLGWVGADGLPMVAPVEVGEARADGIELTGPLPPGGRRAGLCAHDFARFTYGQEQRRHTGWLADGVYAPHTATGYRLPESRLLFHLAGGVMTRRGIRGAPAHLREP